MVRYMPSERDERWSKILGRTVLRRAPGCVVIEPEERAAPTGAPTGRLEVPAAGDARTEAPAPAARRVWGKL